MNPYPSPVVQVEIQTSASSYRVRIPQREIFRVDNIFKHREYAIPNRFLPDKPLCVVDIGANVGLFALYMRITRPDSAIHCFEPVDSTVALLRENLGGMETVRIHPCGLSNRNMRTTMQLHPFNTGENSLKHIAGDACRKTDIILFDAKEAFERLHVDFIDVLKIDTEGCEPEILESLEPMLDRIGLVMLEYHCEQDRRRIDGLLHRFTLFESKVTLPGLGLLKYVHENDDRRSNASVSGN